MPKISREKLLEYLESEYSEELDLTTLMRYCTKDQDYFVNKNSSSRNITKRD